MKHLLNAGLSALLVFSFSSTAKVNPMIVGGNEAAPNEFPFIVSLHERSGHICGGSLIRKNWVLTAGHCVGGRISKVYIGLHDQNSKGGAEAIAPKRIIRHPRYNSSTVDYDFALIELASDSSYPPIAINTEELAISEDPAQRMMSTTAGWGETSQVRPLGAADRLQRVDVPLVTAATCNAAYRNQITDRMICAGYAEGKKDACFGDSGGPLTMTDANGVRGLIGVVSWGEGCARPNKFGVYSKVNSVVDWINQYVQ